MIWVSVTEQKSAAWTDRAIQIGINFPQESGTLPEVEGFLLNDRCSAYKTLFFDLDVTEKA